MFVTADDYVVFEAYVRETELERPLSDAFDGDAVREYAVQLLVDSDWDSEPSSVDLALDCDERGNTVTSEGVSSRPGGDLYQFCYSSCQSKFEDRHERLREGARTDTRSGDSKTANYSA